MKPIDTITSPSLNILEEKLPAFPPEIIENILRHCDHKTITVTKRLNNEWKQIADYVIMKRCFKDISPKELAQYKKKWSENDVLMQWNHLYENWINWQNIAENIHFHTFLFMPKEIILDHITTMCVYGDYIALGISNSVMIFDSEGTLKNHINPITEHEDVALIHFMYEDQQCQKPVIELLIVYPEKVIITDLLNNSKSLQEFAFDTAFSAYRHYFACITSSNQLHIMKVSNKSLNVLYTMSIKATINEDIDTFLWEGRCIVMIENRIKVITFNEDKHDINIVDLKPLQFTVDYSIILGRHHTWIFHESIVIVTYYATRTDDHYLELFLLNDEGTRMTKCIHSWDMYDEEVNFVHLYGNTLILCFMSGWIYFYEMKDWNTLELSFSKKLKLLDKLGPVINVDVKEEHGKRIFYIADKILIHKVVGTFL